MLVLCMGVNCFLLIVILLVASGEIGNNETIDKQGSNKLLAVFKEVISIGVC